VRGHVHTNTVENYSSILKRAITGCYFHVSEAHLHRYLAEFDFRYSNREKHGIDDVSRAELAVKGMKGKRLTYQTTVRERRPAKTRWWRIHARLTPDDPQHTFFFVLEGKAE
jgi:hypothetical protein